VRKEGANCHHLLLLLFQMMPSFSNDPFKPLPFCSFIASFLCTPSATLNSRFVFSSRRVPLGTWENGLCNFHVHCSKAVRLRKSERKAKAICGRIIICLSFGCRKNFWFSELQKRCWRTTRTGIQASFTSSKPLQIGSMRVLDSLLFCVLIRAATSLIRSSEGFIAFSTNAFHISTPWRTLTRLSDSRMQHRLEFGAGLSSAQSASPMINAPALAEKKWQSAALVKDWELPLRW